MNRGEFLQALVRGLEGIAPDEKAAALQYYTEYLDDAGPRREQEVIAELGDPEQIISEIRAESEKEGWSPPERGAEAAPAIPLGKKELKRQMKTERKAYKKQNKAYKKQIKEQKLQQKMEQRERKRGEIAPGAIRDTPSQQRMEEGFSMESAQADTGMWGGSYPAPTAGEPMMPPAPQPAGGPPLVSGGSVTEAAAPRPRSGAAHAWKIVGLVFLWPFIIIAIAVLFVLLIVLVVILAIPLIVGVSVVAGGVGGLVIGGFLSFAVPPGGLAFVGLGLLCIGLGLLCAWAGVFVLRKAVPAVFRGYFSLVKKMTSLR